MGENSVFLLKDRFTSFEDELKKSLLNVQAVEKSISDMASKRRKWLHCVSESEDFEKRLFQKRIDFIRRQLDIYRIERRIETLRLNESLEILERNCSAGNFQNDSSRLNSVNLEAARDSLLQSIEFHSRLNNSNTNLLQEVQSMRAEEIQRNENKSTHLRNQLKSFGKRLSENKKVSATNFTKIMNDYLILRHNARVAKEALAERQNEVSETRSKLQENYEKLMQDVNTQKLNKYKHLKTEVDFQLEYLRGDVIKMKRRQNACA